MELLYRGDNYLPVEAILKIHKIALILAINKAEVMQMGAHL